MSNKLLIYHESLKRLRRRLDVVQQIHLAPQTYVAAVGEVVRRKTFSRAFLQVRASNLELNNAQHMEINNTLFELVFCNYLQYRYRISILLINFDFDLNFKIELKTNMKS